MGCLTEFHGRRRLWDEDEMHGRMGAPGGSAAGAASPLRPRWRR